MKTEDEKKTGTKKDKIEIKSDGPVSEKDEVKNAKTRMREAQKNIKGK